MPSSHALPLGLDVSSEAQLAALAVALGGTQVGGPLSSAERLLVVQGSRSEEDPQHGCLDALRHLIRAGCDPLGDILCGLRSGAERRRRGAFYTPPTIVGPMVDWILDQSPDRVVDPGCGSGRFTAELIRRSRLLQI